MQYAGHSPYGDIYQVNTSAVDNIAKRIYAEKQQRDLLQRQEGKMLDDEFGKNLAKVKSADIPEITQAYNEFKQKHIALQKKGNKVTPQDQMELMMSKANVHEKINGSVQDKDYLKLRADEGKADKRGRYKPNFNIVIQNELNKPTSQRNRDNDDGLLLNQYSFPDLEKVSANMVGGKPTEIKLPTGQKSVKGDLYDDENVYQRFNHPNKMYEIAYLDVSKRADRDAYENIVLNSLNDKEKEDLKTRYFAKVNSPEFKAIYGEVQPFPESAGQTELGQAVALSVMSAVDKLPIQPLRTESKQNRTAVMGKQLANQKTMEEIRQGNREKLLGMREAAKAAGEAANNLWVDRYIVSLGEGKDRTGNINLDPVLSKVLSKDGVSPDKFGQQPNGNFVPIFYKRTKDKNGNVVIETDKQGNNVIDQINTVPMSKEQFKLALGGKAGVKQLNKEMSEKPKKAKYD